MSSKVFRVEVNKKNTCKDNWSFVILVIEYLRKVFGSALQDSIVHTTRVEDRFY